MSLVEIEEKNGVAWLWLNRPERHNALVQPLIDELHKAISAVETQNPSALVISGRGYSFSTGGDIHGFLEASTNPNTLVSYADQLVGRLHDVIMDLLAFPAPVLAAVNGPVTGGSVGLMLAADLVAMAEHAFVQPYYSDVGFGPDGGWTALLPEKVGTSQALKIQYLNTRLDAHEAQRLGLADSVFPATRLKNEIDCWLTEITSRSGQTHAATRLAVWDDVRRETVRRRLDLEKERFLDLIAKPETRHGMIAFTQKYA